MYLHARRTYTPISKYVHGNSTDTFMFTTMHMSRSVDGPGSEDMRLCQKSVDVKQ